MKKIFQRQLQFLFLGIAFLMLIIACQQAPQADSTPTPTTPIINSG